MVIDDAQDHSDDDQTNNIIALNDMELGSNT